MKDIIIIGAGPAGLTAAVYALRAGRSVSVFDGGLYGGQVAITNEVENYPGIEKISGFDLAHSIYNQAVTQGAEIVFEQVTAVMLDGPVKKLSTAQKEYETRAVIIANGVKRRKLGVHGEEELTGKGVSYCATCDGAFFRGKHVAVVGGGNTALEDALYLANVCDKVTLIHRRDTFRGEVPLVEAVKKKANIEIRFDSRVAAIHGHEKVESITVSSTISDAEQNLPVSGVFVAIGLIPDNELFRGILDLDNAGYLQAGENCKTKLPQVYAAGDTRTKQLRQIITAAADGAVAAFEASNALNVQDMKD